MNVFWLLCVTLSLGVLFMSTVLGILLANIAAWTICHFRNRCKLFHLPGLLFFIRILPFAFGAAVTSGFALPSFLLLEPKRSVEAPEAYLVVLAALGLAGILVFALRCGRFLAQSRKTVQRWFDSAEPLDVLCSIPVYRVQSPDSLIAVAGILRPKVFIGQAALASLTSEELDAAIAHELAHVRSLDNLKQLFVKISRLPGFLSSLSRLEAAWCGAAELLADARALQQGTSPLELGSAIVKVGRLRTVPGNEFPVAACHLIPPGEGSSALAIRIQQLQDALEIDAKPRTHHTSFCWAMTLLMTSTAYVLALPTALPIVHRWMEWFVQ
jgi:beta-lactamase regulating signal transducer with metallopeptidase domain